MHWRKKEKGGAHRERKQHALGDTWEIRETHINYSRELRILNQNEGISHYGLIIHTLLQTT